MFFIITPEMEKTPNDWCAIRRHTNKLVDRDEDLRALAERVDGMGFDRSEIIFCKNWFRPTPLEEIT